MPPLATPLMRMMMMMMMMTTTTSVSTGIRRRELVEILWTFQCNGRFETINTTRTRYDTTKHLYSKVHRYIDRQVYNTGILLYTCI